MPLIGLKKKKPIKQRKKAYWEPTQITDQESLQTIQDFLANTNIKNRIALISETNTFAQNPSGSVGALWDNSYTEKYVGMAVVGLNGEYALTFDIGKRLLIRAFNLYFETQKGTAPGSITFTSEYSEDAINWFTIEETIQTATTGTSEYTHIGAGFIARYIRLKIVMAGVGGVSHCRLYEWEVNL